MRSLADLIETNKRFSRSVNIDRDRGVRSIHGYLPTGRAIDVVRRLARGFADSANGRAYSITGPHGGGKSSLAVFLDALLDKRDSAEHAAAMAILDETDEATAVEVQSGLEAIDPDGKGFWRVLATAQREPVTTTIARGLSDAVAREPGVAARKLVKAVCDDPSGAEPQDILDVVRTLSQSRPVMLIVDEFGKNLEAFTEGSSDGDPYLLQQLAELGQGLDGANVFIATLQHLSFDEYVQDVTLARRKEWAKVQGRFQDVPYVETGQQSRHLIAACIRRKRSSLDKAIDAWFDANSAALLELGLAALTDDSKRGYPLHPVTLAVLPDLCARYGQNERTLFSFLSGSEPLALPQLIEDMPHDEVEFVGLDRLYDYFLDSASTAIGSAAQASRWMEIENRIRDASGASEGELRTLKSVGVLNLVSSGGSLRASMRQLELLLGEDVGRDLDSLQSRGLLTYRSFADEWRVWQGSDYDVQGAVDLARREVEAQGLDYLLNECVQLTPSVAARHSQETGVLRLFGQTFADMSTGESPEVPAQVDGLVVFNVGDCIGPIDAVEKPIVICTPSDANSVRHQAVEVAALRRVLDVAREADRVARAEIKERLALAAQLLQMSLTTTWGTSAKWELATGQIVDGRAGLSAVLSTAADVAYSSTPPMRNEMIARRELTSQGAKARRMLIDSMLLHPDKEAFGIEGYGADRAMYEAVFRATGLHAERGGSWSIGRPSDPFWAAAWDVLEGGVSQADSVRVSVPELFRRLEAPPFGLKAGVLPVLLCALLTAKSDEIALYEHGSLVLGLDDAVAERLAKNPGHFTVKNPAAGTPARRRVVKALCRDLRISSANGHPTFLDAALAVFRLLSGLPDFSKRTKQLSMDALAVRAAFASASEPDELFFHDLPELLIGRSISPRARIADEEIDLYTRKLADCLREVKGSYVALLGRTQQHLAQSIEARSVDAGELRLELSGLARQLDGRVLEPRLRAFVGALLKQQSSPRLWLENVAMVVAEGRAPSTWSDEMEQRFILQVEELGGSFRRTMAVLFSRISDTDREFEAVRVSVTRSDGTEYAEVVSINEAERAAVGAVAEAALESLLETFASRQRASRTLMAMLASDLAPVADSEDTEVRADDTPYLRHQRR